MLKNRTTGLAAAAATALLVAFAVPTPSAITAASMTATTAGFRDAYTVDDSGAFAGWTDRIRSDSRAPGTDVPYTDGIDCVIVSIRSSQLFMRTVRSDCSPYVRSIVLDFSERTEAATDCAVADVAGHGTLDICGPNLVPDVRLIASGMFARSAVNNGSAVSLHFSLAPDFHSTGFELMYREELAVTVTAAGARVLTASSELANLYKVTGRKKALLGTYHMPFAMTVQ